MRLFLIPLIGLVSTFCGAFYCNGQEPDPALSLFDSVVANADAWQTGDVLVKYTNDFDSVGATDQQQPKGVSISEECHVRTLFDYKRRRFAQYRLSKTDTTNFTVAADNPIQVITWKAVIVDFEKQIFHELNDKSNGRPYKRTNELERVFTISGIEDYRALGIVFFTSLDPQKEYRSLAKQLASRPDFSKSVDLAKDKIALHYVTPINAEFPNWDNGGTFFINDATWTYTFDKLSSQVVGVQHFVTVGKVLPVESPVSNAKISWQEISDLFVPQSFTFQHSANVNIGGIDEAGTRTTNKQFHWFSLNQPLDERFFDGTYIKDQKAVLDLTLPERTGAKSLSPTKKKNRESKVKTTGGMRWKCVLLSGAILNDD